MADSPTSAGRPENQAKWLHMTSDKMMVARNLTSAMLTALRKNDIAEATMKSAALDQALREKGDKKAKVYNQAKAHEAVISTSFKCMQDIEDAILQAEDSMTKLTHERYKGFANLQVCERRLELREKRPFSEQFKDKLADALTDEKKMLNTARKDLLALEDEGKKIVDDLTQKRIDLSRDTGERRLHMMHDLSSLKPVISLAPDSKAATNTSTSGASGSADAPQAPSSPKNEPPPPPTEEEKKKAEAASKALIESTMKLLERCANHRQKTMELVIKCRQDRDRALLRTDDCLARRCTELSDMKKQLEKHALDVEAAISRAERSLERTERRLLPGDKAGAEKLAADKQLLAQLHDARKKLTEDIRTKFAALEIDNMCRRVTPAKASEAKLKQAGLQRCGSAPTLGKRTAKDFQSTKSAGSFGDTMSSFGAANSEDSTRPPSSGTKPQNSPGGSKSLKAGAAAGLQPS